jgi:hypothetical protein
MEAWALQEEARYRNIEIRNLKAKADKVVSQRELYQYLQHQTREQKQQRDLNNHIIRNSYIDENNDSRSSQEGGEKKPTKSVLPQSKVHSKSEERAQKAKLRHELDTQVETKGLRALHQDHVQRAEERYFLNFIQQLDAQEKSDRIIQKEEDKHALLSAWHRQTRENDL